MNQLLRLAPVEAPTRPKPLPDGPKKKRAEAKANRQRAADLRGQRRYQVERLVKETLTKLRAKK